LTTPGAIADYASTVTNATPARLQQLLSTTNLSDRLYQALVMVKSEIKMFAMRNEISKKVEANFDILHTRSKLKEQKKVIEGLLGTGKNNKEAILEKFRARMVGKTPAPEVAKVIEEEMEKLQNMEGDGSEFHLCRNYLDWLTQIPWGVVTPEKFDLAHAEKVMNEGHFGLDDVKQRILEFVAVGQLLKTVPQGKIMCLVGPPGVGKTSIGKSIADALGRQFYRFSVGGLDDVAEIKGHRRTYLGSMAGKFIQALKATQTSNPVILIDEIDKLGRGHRGDPSAALLEALDPEQNATFTDHFLDVPCDLSKVLFICTANSQDTISHALHDRLDMIPLSGYVAQEKLSIATTYLIPNIRKQTGVQDSQVTLTTDAIQSLIRWYCREPGVRNLNKHLEKIFRKAALRIARDSNLQLTITEKNLSEFVGKQLFTTDRLYTEVPVGVATGLAYTSYGGCTVFIESTAADQKVAVAAPMDNAVTEESTNEEESDDVNNEGSKKKPIAPAPVRHEWAGGHQGGGGFFTTGQMGDVMKESSSIAYTVAKRYIHAMDPSRAAFFSHTYIHMHIPEGGTPKDGPSAGITMVTSLLSLALNTPMAQHVAMTGELTLTGKVVAIGGLKEKVLAAKRAAVTHIMFPRDNAKDWEDIPDFVKDGLIPHMVSKIEEVLQIAFPHVTMTAFGAPLNVGATSTLTATTTTSTPAVDNIPTPANPSTEETTPVYNASSLSTKKKEC